MITVGSPNIEQLEQLVEAFQDRAPDEPIYVKAQLSYAENEQEALDGAYEQWRTNCVPGAITENLRTTAQFDAVGEEITREQVKNHVHVSADLDKQTEWLHEIQSLGVEKVFLHNVNQKQEQFIEQFGDKVLPKLR